MTMRMVITILRGKQTKNDIDDIDDNSCNNKLKGLITTLAAVHISPNIVVDKRPWEEVINLSRYVQNVTNSVEEIIIIKIF